MSKHTPGPWAVYRRSQQARQYDKRGAQLTPGLPWFVCPNSEADKNIGCTIDPEADKKYAVTLCTLNINRLTDEEVIANAAMLAAAPDLADALEKIVAWLDRLAAHAEELAKDTRFTTLAEANAADAKNYRSTAADCRKALKKAGRP